MSSQLACRRHPLRILALALAFVAPAAPTALAAESPIPTAQQNLVSSEGTDASPRTTNSHGFDPYYRDPAPIASRHAATPARDPSGLAIAISIAVTLIILAAIAAHVRWTRIRRHRAARVIA